jgi:hypothetical protein
MSLSYKDRTSPLHKYVEFMTRAIGVPSSCIEKVKCVDCGKEGIAAQFGWALNIKTGESSGPHCGCINNNT